MVAMCCILRWIPDRAPSLSALLLGTLGTKQWTTFVSCANLTIHVIIYGIGNKDILIWR